MDLQSRRRHGFTIKEKTLIYGQGDNIDLQSRRRHGFTIKEKAWIYNHGEDMDLKSRRQHGFTIKETHGFRLFTSSGQSRENTCQNIAQFGVILEWHRVHHLDGWRELGHPDGE